MEEQPSYAHAVCNASAVLHNDNTSTATAVLRNSAIKNATKCNVTQQLIDLIGSAADSCDSKLWIKVIANPRDDVTSALASSLGFDKLKNTRSCLFSELRNMFPDLHSASLITRIKANVVAAADDVFDLAHALVDATFLPALSRCLKVDASILANIIDLRRRLDDLEARVIELSNYVDKQSIAHSSVPYNGRTGGSSSTASYNEAGSKLTHEHRPTTCVTSTTKDIKSQKSAVVSMSPGKRSSDTLDSTLVEQREIASRADSALNSVTETASPPVAPATAFVTNSEDPFELVDRRGKKHCHVFLHNLQASCTQEMMVGALTAAGVAPSNTRRFPSKSGTKCSFKVTVKQESADILIRNAAHMMGLPAGIKVRMWENRSYAPRNGTSSAVNTLSSRREPLASQRSTSDSDASLLNMLSDFLRVWSREHGRSTHA